MSGGVAVDANAGELVALLSRFKRRGGDLSPAMAIVAESLVAAVNDEFESSGRGRWAPLAASTLRSRRGSTAQILLDTGRFAASIRADSGPDFAEAATDVSYAIFHVSDQPRTIIPLRNPFDVPDEVLDEATQLIARYMVEGLDS